MTLPDDFSFGEWASDVSDCGTEQVEFEREFFQAIIDRNPRNVLSIRRLIEAVSRMGDFNRSLELSERLVRLQPADPIAQYNLACAYSLLNRVEPGLNSLQRSLELGYCDIAHLEADSDLDSLRDDPRFDEVLARSIFSQAIGF